MKNPHFGYDKRSTGGDFLIDHFAGDVVYSCHKFLDKNRDTLSPGALAASGLLRCSWCNLTVDASAWFPVKSRACTLPSWRSMPDQRWSACAADLVQLMLGSEHPLLAGLAVDIATSQAKRGSQTVGNRFREQLQDLITRLDECAPKQLA
jgi:myosin heavy subunit